MNANHVFRRTRSSRIRREGRRPGKSLYQPTPELLEQRALLTALVVTGDEFGPANDVILLHTNPANANFAEVKVNGTVRFNLPINSLTSVAIDGLEGNDTITIDDTFAGVPVSVKGGKGIDTINVALGSKNLDHIQGALTIDGAVGNDTVNFNDANKAGVVTYTVNTTDLVRTGAAGMTVSNVPNINLDGGTAHDQYNVESTAASTTVSLRGNGSAGAVFDISPTAKNLNTIAGTLSISGTAGTDTLRIRDTNNAAVSSYSLSSSLLSRTGPSSASVSALNVEDYEVNGGSAANSYTIDGTASGTSMVVFGGASADQFKVTPTAKKFDAIDGNVSIQAGGGADTLTVNDEANAAATTYDIAVNSVSRTGSAKVFTNSVETVNVNAGNVANDFNILGTQNVLNVVGGSSSDDFHLGDASDRLTNFLGTLNLNGAGGTDLVIAKDQDSTLASTYTVTATSLTRTGIGVMNFASVEGLKLNGSSSGDTYSVESTAAGTPLTINAGPAGDVLNVSPTAKNMDAIQGKVTFNADGGSDSVAFFDQNNPAPTVYTIKSTELARTNAAKVTYNDAESVALRGGSASNVFNVESTASATPVSLFGGIAGDSLNVTPTSKNMNDMKGTVSFNGGGGADTVTANDQSNSAATTYALTATQLTRTGSGALNLNNDESLTVNGGSAGNTYNVNGTVAAMPVTLNAGAAVDVFQIAASGLNLDALPGKVTVNGAGGTDLVGVNDQANGAATTYTLTSNLLTRTATVTAQVGFSGIESLAIHGGAGSSTLQVTSLPAGVNVSFDGNGGSDTVVGQSGASTFFISGSNGGSLGSLTFTSVENLKGNSGDDTFKFGVGASLSGTIDGQGGSDTLDYSAFTTGVTVNLATGAATAVSLGVSNIENVSGGSAGDNLTGNSADNIFFGNGGNDVLSGGLGNDVLVGGTGNDTENGGGGRDLLIGGANQDNLNGGDEDDILIGASTNFDTDVKKLRDVMNEWTSASAYQTRIDHLKGTVAGGLNGTTLLNLSKIVDDAISDIMTGGNALDWFFATNLDATDRAANEVLN